MDFRNGKLDLVLGTMFSGKTSYLLSKIAQYSNLNLKILYINIEFDNRSSDMFSTHNPYLHSNDKKNNISQNVTMIKTKKLSNVDYKPYDIIFIDESHFFEDLVKTVNELLQNKKYVIVASLVSDFTGKKFGEAIDLVPMCDEIHKLHAYCTMCINNKTYRQSIYSKKITSNTNIVDIGGSDKYIPVCREHYNS